MTHEFTGDNPHYTVPERRADDARFIDINYKIERLSEKITALQDNHSEHKKELSELSKAVSRLSNTINRAIWILVGAAAVITFLSSGQFTRVVNTGSAVVGAQNGR